MGSPPDRGIFSVMRLLWVICAVITAIWGELVESQCKFEAIFNFGDSNSDTGGFWAAFPAQSGPWGITYFKRPAGRASDGRLIVDFLSQSLGLPFLSPYLQSIGSDYKHGANFATLASTVLLPNTSLFVSGISPFSLAIQLNQMKEFRVKVDDYHSSNGGRGLRILPPPSIFRKSLYTFYIGQNDFTSNLAEIGVDGVKKYLPQVVNQIVFTIKEIYGIGGRTFLILNLAPVGCYPALLVNLRRTHTHTDKYGCLTAVNKGVAYYNKMLKKALDQTRAQLPNASLIYLDTHKVLLDLFRHPQSHGMQHGIRACCGHNINPYNYDPQLFCGTTKPLNGDLVNAGPCGDPHNYVSWDGIHATEAANKLITMAILNGSISNPPFDLYKLCHLHSLH